MLTYLVHCKNFTCFNNQIQQNRPEAKRRDGSMERMSQGYKHDQTMVTEKNNLQSDRGEKGRVKQESLAF